MSSQADALRHERERHVIQGREDRVADIDAELKDAKSPPVETAKPETTEAAPAGKTTAAKRATRNRPSGK